MLFIQKKITNEIIEALKSGVKPWVCPWKVKGENILPINFATGTNYSGVNTVILWYHCQKYGYTSNAWLTFSQAKKINSHVMKGAKGALCVFYTPKEIEDEETGDIKKIPIIKPFVLFNLDQIDGIKHDMPLPDNNLNPIAKGEEILKASQAKILSGSNRAFYSPRLDHIVLPERNAFQLSEDFYATALHELVHWTGHQARLNRKTGKVFGDNDYAFEELVAELGSAFLCGELGLQGDLMQHASYIDSWLKILQQDARAIFRAASLASKAHKYVMDFLEPINLKKVA